MGTITYFLKPAAKPYDGTYKNFALRNRIDFSKKGGLVANDVIQALNVPAGTFVRGVFTRIIKAEGGVATCQVGDGADANGWDAQVDLNAAVGTMTESSKALLEGAPNTYTDAYAVGKLYKDADTIDLTLDSNNIDTGIIDIYADCLDLNV